MFKSQYTADRNICHAKEVALSYDIMHGIYFLAGIFEAKIVFLVSSWYLLKA